jgi:hypothetical protein
MTFDCVERVSEATNVPSFATPVSHTWYKWDEDYSDQGTESGMAELKAEETAPSAVAVAPTTSPFTPLKGTIDSLASFVNGMVSHLSYTRRWYTSLSSVGAAM